MISWCSSPSLEEVELLVILASQVCGSCSPSCCSSNIHGKAAQEWPKYLGLTVPGVNALGSLHCFLDWTLLEGCSLPLVHLHIGSPGRCLKRSNYWKKQTLTLVVSVLVIPILIYPNCFLGIYRSVSLKHCSNPYKVRQVENF